VCFDIIKYRISKSSKISSKTALLYNFRDNNEYRNCENNERIQQKYKTFFELSNFNIFNIFDIIKTNKIATNFIYNENCKLNNKTINHFSRAPPVA